MLLRVLSIGWGYDRHKIETLEKQGDYLESRIHPHDRSQLEDLQVRLGKFIYNQPLNIGMTIVMCIVSVYSMLVETMCV